MEIMIGLDWMIRKWVKLDEGKRMVNSFIKKNQKFIFILLKNQQIKCEHLNLNSSNSV